MHVFLFRFHIYMYIFFKLRLLLHSTAAIICDICSLFIFFIVKNIYDRLKKRCESYEEEFIFDLPIVTESNITVSTRFMIWMPCQCKFIQFQHPEGLAVHRT